MGIVSPKGMIALEELQPEIKVPCRNLVFNKTPEATAQI
jgi:hypothetical protein